MSEFNLDGAIAQWRERLSWRDAFTDADLDEMESHLRDEVASLVSSGLSEQKAFYQTIHTFGEDMKLAWRYNQANWERTMVKQAWYVPVLLGNYFKVAFRNLLKYKMYSAITVGSFAIGIACCIVMLLIVQYERSYDLYHKSADQIYRIVTDVPSPNGMVYLANTWGPVAPLMAKDFPEILQSVRLFYYRPKALTSYGDKRFYESRFFFAEPSVFDIFTIPFVKGDAQTALVHPYDIVITETAAAKYFGSDDPVGKVLSTNIAGGIDFTVTGVVKDVPQNSHLKFDFLASYDCLNKHNILNFKPDEWRFLLPHYAYVRLRDGASAGLLDAQFSRWITKYVGENEYNSHFLLQPLTDIHLHSNRLVELEENGSITQVYAYTTSAVLILFIACINFISLSTARSNLRAKEIGMRRVLGAFKRQLIQQHLMESALLACIALFVALIGIELVMPVVQASLGLAWPDEILFFPALFVCALFVGLFAGLYPAFFISRFQPVSALKGRRLSQASKPSLQKGMLTAQFAVGTVLIALTVGVFEQLDFVQDRDLGFNRDQVLTIPIQDATLRSQHENLKDELKQIAGVIDASASSNVPGQPLSVWTFRTQSNPDVSNWRMAHYEIDYDFLNTFEFDLVAGRAFQIDRSQDETSTFIVNETAVAKLGWQSPQDALGEILIQNRTGRTGPIVGVVKDFHYQSLHHPILPTAFYIEMEHANFLSLKIAPTNMSATLDRLRGKWGTVVPDHPFVYAFLDDEFEKLYRADRRLEHTFGFFALVAVALASAGLLGLVSFVAQQRTVEIGIRKVLGASLANVVTLLARDYLRIIVVANVIALPVAYYALNQWLQRFVYRVELDFGIFLASGFLGMLVALLTISYQSFKAARTNPVDTLRHE